MREVIAAIALFPVLILLQPFSYISQQRITLFTSRELIRRILLARRRWRVLCNWCRCDRYILWQILRLLASRQTKLRQRIQKKTDRLFSKNILLPRLLLPIERLFRKLAVVYWRLSPKIIYFWQNFGQKRLRTKVLTTNWWELNFFRGLRDRIPNLR